MSTETEKITSFPLSDIPDFLKAKKGDISVQELEYQCQKLRDENHQLQLRILGVNELARLLQDRNEAVAMLKDRNKRLEMSLVRLENRCANFERQIKSQKSSSVASVKPGQSPFIPGPSRQILEGLMQENIELKKTVNSLQKKGSSGYLEAVKTTQLEEFIEQQKQEIDQLHGQINSLTSSGEEDLGVSSGGGMSLPTNVTESGPLKRQLIKMQQTMSVKDRFCALLSQQVTELQKKLTSLQSDKKPVSETGGPDEAELEKTCEELARTKKQLDELNSQYQSTLSENTHLEESVRSLTSDKEKLEEKYEATSHIYSTLLSDNAELKSQLDELKSELDALRKGGGSFTDGPEIERLKLQNGQLQGLLDKQVEQYTQELKSKDRELDSMRIGLEESNLKFMQSDSILTQCQNDMKQLEEKIEDLEEDNSILKSRNMELNKDILKRDYEIKQFKSYSRINPMVSLPNLRMRSGPGTEAPHLITPISHGPEQMAKDHVHFSTSMLKSRDPTDNPGSPGLSGQQQPTGQPQQPPKPTELALQQRPEHLPPNSSHRNIRSPVPQARGSHAYPPTTSLQTPVTPLTSTGVPGMGGMGRMYSSTSPAPIGPQYTQGQNYRPGSVTTHSRFSQPQPLNYTGPHVGTPGSTMGGGVSPHMMGGVGSGSSAHSMYTGMAPQRFVTGTGMPPSSSGAPPPLPPRSQQNYQFGNFPPPRSSQQPPYPHPSSYMQLQGQGTGSGGMGANTGPYPPELRDQRPSGSTSPHPPGPHDNPPNMHPSGPYGGSGGGPPPPQGPPYH